MAHVASSDRASVPKLCARLQTDLEITCVRRHLHPFRDREMQCSVGVYPRQRCVNCGGQRLAMNVEDRDRINRCWSCLKSVGDYRWRWGWRRLATLTSGGQQCQCYYLTPTKVGYLRCEVSFHRAHQWRCGSALLTVQLHRRNMHHRFPLAIRPYENLRERGVGHHV